MWRCGPHHRTTIEPFVMAWRHDTCMANLDLRFRQPTLFSAGKRARSYQRGVEWSLRHLASTNMTWAVVPQVTCFHALPKEP